MVKLLPGEVSIFDLVDIANTPGYRTAISWFGTEPKRYAGRSTPLKGFKKKKDEDFPEYVRRVKEAKPIEGVDGWAEGLTKARNMALDTKGHKGVCLVENYEKQAIEVLSRPAAELLEKAGKGRIIQTFAHITPAMKRRLLVTYAAR